MLLNVVTCIVIFACSWGCLRLFLPLPPIPLPLTLLTLMQQALAPCTSAHSVVQTYLSASACLFFHEGRDAKASVSSRILPCLFESLAVSPAL